MPVDSTTNGFTCAGAALLPAALRKIKRSLPTTLRSRCSCQLFNGNIVFHAQVFDGFQSTVWKLGNYTGRAEAALGTFKFSTAAQHRKCGNVRDDVGVVAKEASVSQDAIDAVKWLVISTTPSAPLNGMCPAAPANAAAHQRHEACRHCAQRGATLRSEQGGRRVMCRAASELDGWRSVL
ncbi:hypothetical protein ERJ75_001212000 [Trypanosoma vivax]|nr:hypothetical protein ERJ75_001212000 [Trypanosoma vivax]